MNRLKVFISNSLVGYLYVDKEEIYHFDYTKEWLESGFEISPHIKFNQDNSSNSIKIFFQNIIPEGRFLDEIINFSNISKNNIYAILKVIGNDTAGALYFGEVKEQKEIFREIKSSEIANKLAQKSIAIWDNKIRLSLAGVQSKLPVFIKNGKIGLADGMLSSTHILKFEDANFPNLVINEYFCMRLAKEIGLNVANTQIVEFDGYLALLVERFDRVVKNGRVERLHIIDACQMLNLPPSYKYEQNFGSGRDVKDIREGVSFKKLFKTANRCTVPAVAKKELLNWAIFNLLIGNSDAHGKNVSFYVDKSGIRVAPMYDLVCVLTFNVEHSMAMAYGNEFDANSILAYDLREFAEDIGINYKLVSKTLHHQAKKIIDVIKEKKIVLDLTKERKDFLEKLQNSILNRAKKYVEVAKEMGKISY